MAKKTKQNIGGWTPEEKLSSTPKRLDDLESQVLDIYRRVSKLEIEKQRSGAIRAYQVEPGQSFRVVGDGGDQREFRRIDVNGYMEEDGEIYAVDLLAVLQTIDGRTPVELVNVPK